MKETKVIDDQLNKLLDDIFGQKGDEKSSILQDTLNDNTTLYDVLNGVTGSRKTLNSLLQKTPDCTVLPTRISTSAHHINKRLLEKCIATSKEWEWDDKKSNAAYSSSAATLQLETPVTFAWSNKNSKSAKDIVSMINDRSTLLKRTAGNNKESFRQYLFQIVNNNLTDLTKQSKSWNYIIYGVDDVDNYTSAMDDDFDEKDDHIPSISDNERSLFKVNPLEKFVVTELPREKRNSNDKRSTHKSKTKRHTFRWMWGGSNSKHKSNSKLKQEKTKDLNNNEMVDIRNMDNVDEFTIPSIEAGRPESTENMNLGEVSGENIDFDISNVTSRCKTPPEIPIGVKSSNLHAIDLLSTELETMPTPLGSDMNDTENDDDDEDFGNFEMSSSEEVTKGTTSYSNVSIGNNSSDSRLDGVAVGASRPALSPLGLMSFVPLEPQKRR